MRYSVHLVLVLTVGFLAGCASTRKSSGSLPTAQVRATDGLTEIQRGDYWKFLRVGSQVREGDVLRTGHDSTVDLNFGPYGGTMRLTPDSQIRIEQFGWTEENSGRKMLVLIDLQRGRITGDTLNPAENTRFQVKTLRGTHDLN